MHQKKSIDSIRSRRLIDDNSNQSPVFDQQIVIDEGNTQVLIDTDQEEEFTSSGVSEDDQGEEEEEEENDDENISSENSFEEGNLLQTSNQCNPRNNATDLLNLHQHNGDIFIETEDIIEVTPINNDHIIAQTMAVLAAKHRHEKPCNSMPTESDILSFIGPCPLYSLASSFGLDMYHGLSSFPCRDVLANGGGHLPALPLWQHLTSSHNLNLSSSSLLITHLLLHGYSSPSPLIFNSPHTTNVLRTTPRYSFARKCPLTKYGICGIQFEHGARLCSGYTYSTNIYFHLTSFHKMTNDAALRLSRALAFHDQQFQFNFNEIIVTDYIKPSRLRQTPRLLNNHCFIFKKLIKQKPVKTV